jgi:hypothetical protein
MLIPEVRENYNPEMRLDRRINQSGPATRLVIRPDYQRDHL